MVAVFGSMLGNGLQAQASQETVARVLEEGQQASRVMDHLDHLVNRIGPRLTSSDNLTNACEWARSRFESFGLEARLDEWGTFPVGFNRGPWWGRMLEPERMEFTFKTNAWTAGTKGVAKGKVMMCPKTVEEIQALGTGAAGVWFLDPPMRRRGSSFGPRQTVADALADLGALGLIAMDPFSGRGERLITSGNQRVRFDSLPRLPVVNLLHSQHVKLREMIQASAPVIVEFDIRNYFKNGPIKLYNVVAEIPGTKYPDQYVIVGGHLDSWDGATGTTDNGTGVATTLEAARLLAAADVKPLRTIRFMLWGGEEQGLLGSVAHIRKYPEETAKVSAVLVHDGGTNHVSGISAVESMLPALEKAFAPVIAADLALPFEIRRVRAFSPIGSDHDSYMRVGVPGFFWNQAGAANYGRTHHTQQDTYDAAIEEYQRHSSMVIALGAAGLANLPDMVSREGAGYQPSRGGTTRRVLGVLLDEDCSITRIEAASLAAKSGLKVGDRILSVGETAVDEQPEVSPALQKGERTVQLGIQRGDARLTVVVEFAR